MLGRRDAGSGEPIQASTAWGTHSKRIRDAISIERDETHTHQRVEGSNSNGSRPVQKAEWPRKACRTILTAVVKELHSCSRRFAFAGEHLEEDRHELGPLDAPEEDADDTSPPIGKNLSKLAEDEFEFLDGLKIEGISTGRGSTQKDMDGVASSDSYCDTHDASHDRRHVEQRSYPSAEGHTCRQEAH